MKFLRFQKTTQPIQFITLAYGILYALLVFSDKHDGIAGVGVYSLFVLFIVGTLTSWLNKIITGVIFFIWTIGMWIFSLYFFPDGDFGMGIFFGIPLIVLGVSFIIKGLETVKKVTLTPEHKLKTSLKLYLILYTILYILVISDDISRELNIDFLSFHGISLILLFLIFSVGYFFSWKNEFIAGIIFIAWYVGVVLTFLTNELTGNRGFWGYSAIVVLIQGILYIIYHFKFKVRQIQA